jgi:hypothetical protein
LLVGIWIFPGEGYAQLVGRSLPGYTSYAVEGYRRMGRDAYERLTVPVFDEFGTLVMNGMEIYNLSQWHPSRDDPATVPREPGSILRKGLQYHDYLARLVVAHDTFRGSNQRIIIGDRIRTRFSSLTLDQAALNGIRWDGDFGRSKFSAVTSRVDKPIFALEGVFPWEHLRASALGISGYGPASGLSQSLLAAFLLGGHGETQLGIFTIGATCANQFRVDTQIDLSRNSFKGTLPTRTPSGIAPALRPAAIDYLVVKVADGSDRDGGGARVLDIKISINGVERPDIEPAVTRHDSRAPTVLNINGDQFFPPGREIPPYVEFIKGFLPKEAPSRGAYLEATGTEYLLYWFRMPDEGGATEVHFDALVANDYEISLAEVYVATAVFQRNMPESRNRATYYYRVASSPRRVTDGSNLGWIGFDYGRQTGVAVGSVNVSATVPGLLFNAEYARSYASRQYPDLGGRYHHRSASAYYANIQKALGRGHVGFEYFGISPYYTTALSIEDVMLDAYSEPFAAELNGSFDARRNNTIESDLVDDNDDRDPYPDWHFLPSHGDNDGVFPDQDLDHDGRPDINQNANGVPDYLEPFLLFYVDPDDFAFGDDMDNNGIIDTRQNDSKPDYPYDQDSRGLHLFAVMEWENGTEASAGHLQGSQYVGGGRNRVSYAKAEYRRAEPRLGRIRAAQWLKRVEDTIPNDVYAYGYDYPFGPLGAAAPVDLSGTSQRDAVGIGVGEVEDQLYYRNSVVSTTYVEGELECVRGLKVRLNAKYDQNFQRRTAHQRGDRITSLAWVAASEYVIRWGKAVVRAQLKYTMLRRHDDKGRLLPVFEKQLYPMLRVDYPLTPNTALRFGVQGPARYINVVNESANQVSWDSIASLANTSSYSGYNIVMSTGYQLRRRTMTDRSRRGEDVDFSLVFLRMIVGLRPLEAR